MLWSRGSQDISESECLPGCPDRQRRLFVGSEVVQVPSHRSQESRAGVEKKDNGLLLLIGTYNEPAPRAFADTNTLG